MDQKVPEYLRDCLAQSNVPIVLKPASFCKDDLNIIFIES